MGRQTSQPSTSGTITSRFAGVGGSCSSRATRVLGSAALTSRYPLDRWVRVLLSPYGRSAATTTIAGGVTRATTPAGAVRAAREVVPAHVVGQRDVVRRVRAHPSRSQLLPPRLRGAEVLDDLRAGVALPAAIQDSPGGQPTDVIGPSLPPERPLAARLV